MNGFLKRLLPAVAALAAYPSMAGAQSLSTDGPFAAVPLQEDDLQAVAGREDTTQLSTAHQVAGVTQSSVGDHVQTGDAKIADNAFQNLSGLSILNVNTGNNVAINAAMNVNIAIEPPRP